MDTHKRLHENISALADGELAQSEQELAFAALQTAEGRAAWQAYHLVGDVLRDSARGALSDGFTAALAARLATEAAHQLSPLTAGVTDPAAPPFAPTTNCAAAGANATNAAGTTGTASAAGASASSAATGVTCHDQDQSPAHVIFP